MSKTFPNINYKTMREVYDKCIRIKEFLSSSLPVGDSVEDYIECWESGLWSDDGLIVFGYSPETEENVITAKYISGIVMNGDLRETLESHLSLGEECVKESVFDKYSLDRLYEVKCRLDSLAWLDKPEHAFHKSVYTQASKALQALQSENNVNTMNINLAAALQFLEELDEAALGEGLYQYDTDKIGDKVEKRLAAFKDEKQTEYDAEYAKQAKYIEEELDALRDADKREGKTSNQTEKRSDDKGYDKESKSKGDFVGGFFAGLVVAVMLTCLGMLIYG